MENVLKSTKGITLIALVITIIVLLILAGVSIAMLTGDNGILTQAQNAKKETERASIIEQVRLDILEKQTVNGSGDITAGELEEILKKYFSNEEENLKDIIAGTTEEGEETKLISKEDETIKIDLSDIYNGDITDETTPPTPPEEDNEATVGVIVQPGEGNKDYTNGGYTAKIPEGFMIVPGLDNIEEGLVISDNQTDTEVDSSSIVALGNQFVWVPVPEFTEFKRYDFQNNTEVSSDYTEESADGTANSTEVEKMYKSVKDNKGFYIGRYEAGNDGSDNAISKKNQNPYVNIGWNNDGTMITETGGAVEKARNFSTQSGHTSVTSTLVYGVQWDAVMRWISEDTELSQYLTNSTGKGNYSFPDLIPTGSNPEYQLKNIYDMAGNVSEWTMEAYSTDSRVDRGGYCDISGSGSYDPVSNRYRISPDVAAYNIGFRLAFFV